MSMNICIKSARFVQKEFMFEDSIWATLYVIPIFHRQKDAKLH